MLPSPATFDENDNYVYNEKGTEAIKRELMEGRAVSIAFYADTSRPGQTDPAEYIDLKNRAHYTYEPRGTTHVVAIVGWDDNYQAENFAESFAAQTTPTPTDEQEEPAPTDAQNDPTRDSETPASTEEKPAGDNPQNDPTPYSYQNGTSMACPTAAGAATVLLENNPDMSSAELAALIKGATRYNEAYEDICETAGVVSVDGAANPRPAISTVADNANGDEGTFAVTGFFFGANPQVSVNGVVVDAAAQPSAFVEGATELVCTKPADLEAGTAEVRVTIADGSGSFGRAVVSLSGAPTTALWDNPNLAVPEAAYQWGNWGFAAYAGDVYLLPRSELVSSIPFNCIYRYQADEDSWAEIPLPSQADLEAAGLPDGVVNDVTATAVSGKLLVQLSLTDVDVTTFWWLDPNETWTYTGCTMTFEEDLFGSGGTLASDGERVWSIGSGGVSFSNPEDPTSATGF